MTNNQRPVLVAETRKARKALQSDQIPVDVFPFRIGRESRIGIRCGQVRLFERKEGSPLPDNDVYLLDSVGIGHISREHFQIEETTPGNFELVDRGSTCGTGVAGSQIGGGRRGGRCTLRDGDRIVVGSAHSPYVYTFVIDPAAQSDVPGHTARRRHDLLLAAASLLFTVLTFAAYFRQLTAGIP